MEEHYRETAEVIRQEQIAPGIFDLRLKVPEIAAAARCGQFVGVYCKDKSRLLPRPISICRADARTGHLRLVYRVAGAGTEEFSRLKAGDDLLLQGPLGNGFPVGKAERKKVLLIAGGIGIPPMLQLACDLKNEGGAAKLQIVFGYRDSTGFLLKEAEEYAPVWTASEDGSVGTKGNVLDAVRENRLEADVIYACGPGPMLKALKAYAEENGIECWLSLEEKMACGVGACLACVCRSTAVDGHSGVKNKRVCKEGPVFLSTEVEL